MSKTIKITKSQINNLINEEVARFKKIKSLENRKNAILSQLNEMYELEELAEIGIDEANVLQSIGSGIKKAGQAVGTKIGQGLGIKMAPEKAAAETINFLKTFKIDPWLKQFGTDAPTFTKAITDFMINTGGPPVLVGGGKNAEWDATEKTLIPIKTSAIDAVKQGGFSLGVVGKKLEENHDNL